MRRWGLAMAFAAFAAGVAASAPQSPWPAVEQFTAGQYRLSLEKDPVSARQGGSEDSPRLAITAPGRPPLVISVEGGLLTIRDGLGPAARALAAGNRLASRYILNSPRLKDRAGRPLLIVLGQAFASDPGSIRVISLAGDAPQVLLSEDVFQLHDIADLDHDGVPELIGQRSLSQSFDHCRWTYDPYAVLVLAASSGRYEYSEPLSKAYNLAHYAGWAGPTAREDIAVDHCGKSGNRIVPAPKPAG